MNLKYIYNKKPVTQYPQDVFSLSVPFDIGDIVEYDVKDTFSIKKCPTCAGKKLLILDNGLSKECPDCKGTGITDLNLDPYVYLEKKYGKIMNFQIIDKSYGINSDKESVHHIYYDIQPGTYNINTKKFISDNVSQDKIQLYKYTSNDVEYIKYKTNESIEAFSFNIRLIDNLSTNNSNDQTVQLPYYSLTTEKEYPCTLGIPIKCIPKVYNYEYYTIELPFVIDNSIIRYYDDFDYSKNAEEKNCPYCKSDGLIYNASNTQTITCPICHGKKKVQKRYLANYSEDKVKGFELLYDRKLMYVNGWPDIKVFIQKDNNVELDWVQYKYFTELDMVLAPNGEELIGEFNIATIPAAQSNALISLLFACAMQFSSETIPIKEFYIDKIEDNIIYFSNGQFDNNTIRFDGQKHIVSINNQDTIYLLKSNNIFTVVHMTSNNSGWIYTIHINNNQLNISREHVTGDVSTVLQYLTPITPLWDAVSYPWSESYPLFSDIS